MTEMMRLQTKFLRSDERLERFFPCCMKSCLHVCADVSPVPIWSIVIGDSILNLPYLFSEAMCIFQSTFAYYGSGRLDIEQYHMIL